MYEILGGKSIMRMTEWVLALMHVCVWDQENSIYFCWNGIFEKSNLNINLSMLKGAQERTRMRQTSYKSHTTVEENSWHSFNKNKSTTEALNGLRPELFVS